MTALPVDRDAVPVQRDPGPLAEGFVAFADLRGDDLVVVEANDAWTALHEGLTSGSSYLDPTLSGAVLAVEDLLEVRRSGCQKRWSGVVHALATGQAMVLDVTAEPYGAGDEASEAGVRLYAVDQTPALRAMRRLEEQQRLLEQVASSGDLSVTLEGLVRLIESLSSQGLIASVLLVEDGRLRHGAAPSLPDFYNEAIDGVEVGPVAGSCGTAAFRREPVIVTDVMVDPLWEEYRPLASQAGVRACWSTPLLGADGEVLGTFAMYYREPRAPEADDLAAASMFARAASLAVERARLDRARAASEAQLRFFLDASSVIAGATGYVDAAQELTRLVVAEICVVCAVDVPGDGGVRRIAAAVQGNPEAERRLRRFAPQAERGHPAALVLEGTLPPVTTRGTDIRAYAGGPEHVAVLEDAGVSEFAVVPLIARGATFGTLTLMATAETPLTASSLAVAEGLALRIAQVMDTVRQIDLRQTLVQQLQAGLLPPTLPSTAGLVFESSYHAGAEGLDVGGDFFDVVEVGDGRCVLAVGDVSGKGARAATTTAVVRHTLRALVNDGRSIEHVLSATHDALCAHSTADEDFVTATFVELTRQADGRAALRVVNAGHPPAVVRRRDGSLELLDATGPLLGQFPDTTADVTELVLNVGDTLVLYTDGVIEARGTGRELFGQQRLEDVIRGSGGSARDVVTAIDAAVAAFVVGSAVDDRATLAVTVTGA